jgi:hypothetical protein
MIIKLFSTSKPINPDVTGGEDQVCSQDDHKKFLVNVIEAGNVAAIGDINLKGNMAYLFEPRIRRSLAGTPIGIVGNSINVQEYFSLLYISLSALLCFEIAKAKDASLSRLRAPEPLFVSQLKDTKWKSQRDTYVFLFPSIIPFYNGCKIPYENILSDDGKAALRT